MKKARLPLLIVLVVVGSLYLRSLWWGSRSQGEVLRLAFSSDGKTLLVAQDTKPGQSYQLSALDATRDYATRWTQEYPYGYKRSEGHGFLGQPQFFASDTRFLMKSVYPQTFDAQTGQMLWKYEDWGQAAVSPDGKWLAHDDGDPRAFQNVLAFLSLRNEIQPQQQANAAKTITGSKALSALCFAFSPEGSTLVVGVSAQGRKREGTHLDFYDVKTWKRLRRCQDFKMPKTVDVGAVEGVVQWSRNGRFLLASWLIYHSNIDYFVADRFPPIVGISLWRASDGKRLASTMLQSRTGSPFPNDLPPFSLDLLEVQNDGRVLAVGADGRVFLDNVATLSLKSKPLLTLPKETITAATMSTGWLTCGSRNEEWPRSLATSEVIERALYRRSRLSPQPFPARLLALWLRH